MIDVPYPSRQIAFHQLLAAARKTWLRDGLADALRSVQPATVKEQLADYVPADVLQILASAGIRDEYVFPVPAVLEAQPTLIGYYRLLLGVSQKTFYGTGTGLARFKSMESRGTLNPRQREQLSELCSEMAKALAELVRQLSPAITKRDIDELPMLTLGSQFQGANNVMIGQQAIVDVFLAISEIVGASIVERTGQLLRVDNASGRTVRIGLAADPDVRIEEEFGDDVHRKVAIEVKGGTDRSNAHNRAGEAEKSHQKARAAGFREFWTIIALKGVDVTKLRGESPTTNSWFDAAQVLGRDGPAWEDFRTRVAGVVGIPLS
ncbi:MAG: XcyI family restriction endonuclease [Gaiellales bacterium]